MSSITDKMSLTLGVIFFAVLLPGHAGEWVRGSVAVVSIEGDVEMGQFGAEASVFDPESVPNYLEGLLTVQASDRGTVFLEASNHVKLYSQGPGYFGIERFEQTADFTDGWFLSAGEAGQSRMIFNLRAGKLVIDSRSLSEGSPLTLETPFGRISVKTALCMVEVTHNLRKQQYSFTIQCAEGALSLTDHTGSNYKIRSGQRISGAGAASAPSVEVARITSQGYEEFERFSSLVEATSTQALSAEALVGKMSPVRHKVPGSSGTESPLQKPSASHELRPLLIEYTPRSAPVTPFRGVAPPPSTNEADLF